jgi:hypothetical protein
MERIDTCRRDNNSQEAKDRSEQGTREQRGDIQGGIPNGEEEQCIGDPSTTKTCRGSTWNYIKCYTTRARLD